MLSVGDIVRVRRPRDGRLKSSAYVESYDSSRQTVRILLPSGERRFVKRNWCTAQSSSSDSGCRLPPDVLRTISCYMSARRTCRASQVCSSWRLAFGKRDGQWANRLAGKWPPPVPEAVPLPRDFCELFQLKLRAERDARDLAKRRKTGFSPRVCAWPDCCKLLHTRKQAFSHHLSHAGCWGTYFTRQDVVWLKGELTRLKQDAERQKRSGQPSQHSKLLRQLDNCKSIIRFVRLNMLTS